MNYSAMSRKERKNIWWLFHVFIVKCIKISVMLLGTNWLGTWLYLCFSMQMLLAGKPNDLQYMLDRLYDAIRRLDLEISKDFPRSFLKCPWNYSVRSSDNIGWDTSRLMMHTSPFLVIQAMLCLSSLSVWRLYGSGWRITGSTEASKTKWLWKHAKDLWIQLFIIFNSG